MTIPAEKQSEWSERLEYALGKVQNDFYHPDEQQKIEQVIEELNKENTADLYRWQEILELFISDFHKNSYPYAVEEIQTVYNEMESHKS